MEPLIRYAPWEMERRSYGFLDSVTILSPSDSLPDFVIADMSATDMERELVEDKNWVDRGEVFAWSQGESSETELRWGNKNLQQRFLRGLEASVEEFKGEGAKMPKVRVVQRKVMLMVNPFCWGIGGVKEESERCAPPRSVLSTIWNFDVPREGGGS
jgi:hypothetical protein